MKNKIGHMEVGEDNLIKKPEQVFEEAENLKEMALRHTFLRKEEVTGDQGDQSTGDNPKGEMEKVKHTREEDPEAEEDDESCKKDH